MDEQTTQSEALKLLGQVIQDLTNQPYDLKTNLRRCQHACEILGWQSRRDWFHQELNGYYKDSLIPEYRKIPGTRRWTPTGSLSDTIKWDSEKMVYGVDDEVYEIRPDSLEVRASVDWLKGHSQFGYSESLNQTKQVVSPSGRSTLTLERKRVFRAGEIAHSLSQIAKHVFDFASISYAQLRFGDVIGDIWARYRREVDDEMTNLNLTGHLSSIENGLLSDNPEEWRSAAFECRNMLNDLANHLWRDPRSRYQYLPGDTKEGTLDVSQGKFGNRIAAYIHQKGITGTRGRFIRKEALRLASSIQALISLQNEAHEPIAFQDTQSIAIFTYILVGEVARRTDLKPVSEYGTPAIKN